MNRVQLHYASKCLIALFEDEPKLAQYLDENDDGKLINDVWPACLFVESLHSNIPPNDPSIQLSLAASNQRSLHSTYMRSEILGYLQPSPDVDLGILMPSNLPSEMRGLNHKMTARFLIPRRLLEAFEANPDMYVLVRP
jgi:hypothetical protein